jgi:hypothetical protein
MGSFRKVGVADCLRWGVERREFLFADLKTVWNQKKKAKKPNLDL